MQNGKIGEAQKRKDGDKQKYSICDDKEPKNWGAVVLFGFFDAVN